VTTIGDNLMTDILTDLTPTTLATAVKANLYAFFQAMGNSANAIIQNNPYGFNWRTNIPHPWFNGALSTLNPKADVNQTVHETVNYFQANDVTSFTWWLAPHLESTAWRQHLLAHGFQYDSNTPGMAIDLDALPQPAEHPLTIREVEEPQMLAEWVRVFVRGFEMPVEMAPGFLSLLQSLGIDLPLRHYLGYLNDKPVASSTLFLGAGVAGIYNVATVAEARGQGIGSAMTLAPLYEARAMGYRASVLQSSKMGYGVYQRLGFQKLCQMEHFYWQAAGA
jgi:ribosomal protein S18 acetylase RimI-like enzyme